MNLFSKKKHDPRIEHYVQATGRKWDRSLPADQTKFVVIDLETTGFSMHEDKILSMAALPLVGRRCTVGELKNWIIYYSDAEVTPAMKVHTILPSESSQGVHETDAILELLKFLEGAIIIGHHIHFDTAMLNRELRMHFGAHLLNPTLDTAKMAMQCIDSFQQTGYGNQRPPGLDEVCARLGLPLWERHTADGDTFGTAQLYLMLLAKLERKLGRPATLKDLPIERSPY